MTDTSCPKCQSKAFKRNGYTRHGKQNHRCLDCGRQFSVDLDKQTSMSHAAVDLTEFCAMRTPVFQI